MSTCGVGSTCGAGIHKSELEDGGGGPQMQDSAISSPSTSSTHTYSASESAIPINVNDAASAPASKRVADAGSDPPEFSR